MSVATAQIDFPIIAALSACGSAAPDHQTATIEDLEASRQRFRGASPISSPMSELRSRLFDDVERSLSGEEVLHLLLANIVDEQQALRLAQVCMQRFGTVGALFAAKEASIKAAFNGDVEPVVFLRSVHRLLQHLLREPLEDRPVLNDHAKLYDYLRITLANETHEVVRLLFLNGKNALLKDELHARGTINHTTVYPLEVVRRVIDVNASALIIAHNHPSGDPSPSKDDVAMTTLLKRVLNDIGIVLHDHIIVGKRRCESMMLLGLI